MSIIELRRYANSKRTVEQAKTKGKTSELPPEVVNDVMDVQAEIWRRKQAAKEQDASEG